MATLNLNNYTTVLNDDFTKDTSLNTSIWTAAWGNPDQYWFTGTSAGLLMAGSQFEGWNPVGIEQSPTSKSAGEGYGLFSFTGYAGQAGQGVGICFLLWPSDNNWLPSNKAGQASEIDLLESWDGTKTGTSTLHYYDPNAAGTNGQEFFDLGTSVDLTKSHTYALDWERGSLTYYVDGTQIYQDTTHVPLDFADGGVNETMGAEVVNEAAYATTATVQLYIQDISYSTANAAGTTTTPVLPPVQAPAPAPVPVPVPVPVVPTITLTAPGTVQESSVGAGVTVTETITTTGLTTAYAEVLTSAGAVESGWQAVALDATGKASLALHLAHSGDMVRVADSSTAPTVTATSSAVTITDPVVVPVPVTPPGSSRLVLGTSAAGPFTMQVVDNISNGTNSLELDVSKSIGSNATMREFVDSHYVGTVRDNLADGSYSIGSIGTAGLTAGAHTVQLTLDGSSSTATVAFILPGAHPVAPVSVPKTIALSAPGTMQEASVGAGVTFNEAITTTGLSSVYAEVLTSSGKVESAWQTVTLNATGKTSLGLHLAHSGDVVRVVNSTTNPTVSATSGAVTITDPAPPAPVPPANGTVLGSSAAGPLSFSVVNLVSNGVSSLQLDLSKTTGQSATVREVVDNHYVGTLRDNLADGTFNIGSIGTSNLAAGAHSIQLTLDGSSSTATAAFTMPG